MPSLEFQIIPVNTASRSVQLCSELAVIDKNKFQIYLYTRALMGEEAIRGTYSQKYIFTNYFTSNNPFLFFRSYVYALPILKFYLLAPMYNYIVRLKQIPQLTFCFINGADTTESISMKFAGWLSK